MSGSGLDDILPLAPAQEGLLYHALLAGDSHDVYLVQCRFGVVGPARGEELRDAVRALLARYPNLRACFRQRGPDRPVQLIPHRAEPDWTEVCLPGAGPDERAAALSRLMAADRSRPFEMTRPPLLRCTLVRYQDGSADLLLTLHHILIDGWSMPILAHDLAEFYAGRGAGLPPAPPYRNYLAWVAGTDESAALRDWGAALGGAGPTLIAPRPAVCQADSTQTLEFQLSAALTAAVRRRARESGVTVNTVAQAAWGLALARTVGADDVVFGAVVSGRSAELPGVEATVGLLINTLPVRVRLRPGERTAELLRRLQGEQLRLAGHHHVRLADVQRLAGQGTLFDSVLAFENYPRETGPSAGTGLWLAELADATHYPLTIKMLSDDRLWLRFGYYPGRLGSAAAEALAGRMVRALEVLTGDGDTPVVQLDVRPGSEYGELLPPRRGALRPPAERTAPGPFSAPAAGIAAEPAVQAPGERMLCELFAKVLGLEKAEPDLNFFDAGGHSLLAMRLAAAAEQALGTRVPLAAVYDAPTPAALSERLKLPLRAGGPAVSPVLTLRSGGNGVPLFCLPPGMGLGLSYATLLPHLAGRPVHALQAAALAAGCPLPESVGALAEDYLDRIRAIWPDGPYLLLGTSFGGLLSYEIGARLLRAGRPVGLVAIVDAMPGRFPGETMPPDAVTPEEEALYLLAADCSVPLPSPAGGPGNVDRAALFAAVRSADGPLHGASDRTLGGLVDLCARHIRLAHGYRPPPFDGPVVLFSAQSRPGVPDTAAKAGAWRRTAGEVLVHKLDCPHTDVMRPPAAAAIARALAPILREF